MDRNLRPPENLEESNDPEPVEGPVWYVYICESAAKHYYVGISPDPKARLKKHNAGVGAKMAYDQHGFTLQYISGAFTTKAVARRRELQIKKWSRQKKENLIKGVWQ